MTSEVHQLGVEAERRLQDHAESQQHGTILTVAAQGQMKRALIKYLSASKAKWIHTPISLPTSPTAGGGQEDVEMKTLFRPESQKNSLPSSSSLRSS